MKYKYNTNIISYCQEKAKSSTMLCKKHRPYEISIKGCVRGTVRRHYRETVKSNNAYKLTYKTRYGYVTYYIMFYHIIIAVWIIVLSMP